MNIRKKLYSFLAVLLVMAFLPISEFSVFAQGEQEVESIAILSPPAKTELIKDIDGDDYGDYFYYLIFREGFQMKVNYTDGSDSVYAYNETYSDYHEGHRVEFSDDQSPENPWGIGKHSGVILRKNR